MRLSNDKEFMARDVLKNIKNLTQTMLTTEAEEAFEVMAFEEDCKRLQFFVDQLFQLTSG